jgi:hypothetical protein
MEGLEDSRINEGPNVKRFKFGREPLRSSALSETRKEIE